LRLRRKSPPYHQWCGVISTEGRNPEQIPHSVRNDGVVRNDGANVISTEGRNLKQVSHFVRDDNSNFKKSKVMFLINPNTPHSPYPAYAHGAVNDIQDFDAGGGDAVDDQMRADDDVAVFVALRREVTAGRIGQIAIGKRIQSSAYLLYVAHSLNFAKRIDGIIVDVFTTFLKLAAYFIRLAWYSFLHSSNSLSASSMVKNGPASMRRICAKNSSCVTSNGKLGLILLDTDTSGSTTSLYMFNQVFKHRKDNQNN